MNTVSPHADLANALRKSVRGEVKFDSLTRQLYSTDASSYRLAPLGVVLPRDADDVCAAISAAAQFNAPVLPRGSGTSISGQTVGPAVILDTSRYLDSILEVNAEEGWARAQAGVVRDHLNTHLAPHGLLFGPDPASSMAATLGGMLGNNSTGMHSILYGMSADHTLELDLALADGSRLTVGPDHPLSEPYRSRLDDILTRYRSEIETRYPKTWRAVAGYNLNRMLESYQNLHPNFQSQTSNHKPNPAHLFVGSEGTLAVILSAKVKLVPKPKRVRLAIIHFGSLRAALESTPAILDTGPSAIELADRYFFNLIRRVPSFARRLTFIEGDPEATLTVEYYGETDSEVAAKAQTLRRLFRDCVITEQIAADEINNVWGVRKAAFGLLMSKRGDAKPLFFVDDAAVPVAALPEYADGVARVCADAGAEVSFIAHASAGCLHVQPVLNLKTPEGLRQMRRIADEVIALAIRLGGATTGEHGEGLARSCFNEQLFGPQLHRAFQEVKALFDPHHRMNPGKIVNAPPMDDPAILRYNPDYRTPFTLTQTHFSFSTEQSFAALVEMCNGQSQCRARGALAGAMCPSFIATRDERHSTRGRANALRAAISGQLGPRGLDDPDLFDALDLCLSCKACKSECPSTVDMAKLKAEYLAHYYERGGPPIRNRVFGHIAAFNRMSRWARPLANWAFRNPVAKGVVFRALGIHPNRNLPLLAPQTFEAWFRGITLTPNPSPFGRGEGVREVILFADTFTNDNDPRIGQAAVEVLEAAGYRVSLAENTVCCGRPLISKGLLAEAKRNAARNIAALAPFAERGLPILFCEPSCASALRDEYPDFFPSDPRARAVADHTFFLDEWIVAQAEAGKFNARFDSQPRRVLYHTHCHQRALADSDTLARFFALIPNCEAQSSNAGCCGMAGSFGYEREHYDVSMAVGEDRLFPAARAAAPDTIIAAPGTSCRSQIGDGAGRRALHPIEVMRGAML
ncbi:MAG: FAD-binding protein [Chloroflexi bacterium]|nr:FAD-binding protein [Chloroflexota bacterium]